MAQIHRSSSRSRASRVLPTVTCSTCASPVPLSALSEHICPQLPKVPNRSPLSSTPAQQSQSSSSSARSLSRPQDYMPGGVSGMAGVGRRAFQAVAQAALLAQYRGAPSAPEPPQAAPDRRGNQPRLLDTRTVGRGTPPLSPNSSQSSAPSHSPLSPLSQSSIGNAPTVASSRSSPPMPGPPRAYSNFIRSPPREASSTPTPTASRPIPERYKNVSPKALPTSPSPPSKRDPVYTPRATQRRPPSPANSDGSSVGLAYDRDEGEPVGILGRLSLEEKERTSVSSYSVSSAATKQRLTRDDTPPPRRSLTNPSARGGLSPRSPSSPPGAATRSVSDSRSVRKDSKSKRPRVCIRCEHTITDSRWVRTDTSKGVLCERCWKNMYLPKCRRCDQPIEKAAVFSSDGQLKGKYHRACFTCHVCRRPFPDKSFYVYDGHPLCAFHYAEANRSLCASRTCGRPVEGRCAVTEGGARFHPNCLRCDHAGCGEQLEDYWEVGGMMLCERHAQRDEVEDEEEERDTVGELRLFPTSRRPPKVGSREGRAQKRTTHLINLAG